MAIRTCVNCGGDIIGNGYTSVEHCENADLELGIEPDAELVYCINPVCKAEASSIIQAILKVKKP
jgi:hypothetical protein